MSRRQEIEELTGGSDRPRLLPSRMRLAEPEAAIVDAPVKRGRGRPKKAAIVEKAPAEETVPLDEDMSYRAAYRAAKGVPVRWLAHAFQMTEHMVKKKLSGLPPDDFGEHGNPLYMLTKAAPYLVEAQIDVKSFLAGIKDEDLPDDLRLKLWQARKMRNQVLADEGELWHSQVVLAKFSEALLSLREKLQLIPEKIERMTGLSVEQYKLVRSIVDAIQEDMHKEILAIAEADDTRPVGGADAEEVIL